MHLQNYIMLDMFNLLIKTTFFSLELLTNVVDLYTMIKRYCQIWCELRDTSRKEKSSTVLNTFADYLRFLENWAKNQVRTSQEVWKCIRYFLEVFLWFVIDQMIFQINVCHPSMETYPGHQEIGFNCF